MIQAEEAIRVARGLIGMAYSELDCINLIKKVIRTAPGGDKRYTTAGTNELWNSFDSAPKYRHLIWRQAGISGAKAGMVETALTEKNGWNGLGVHRMIEVNGYMNDEDVQIDAKYSIGEYAVSYEKGLRLRKRPGLTGAYMLTMPCGAKLTVTEIDGDWGKATYNGHQGWCSLAYCDKVGAQTEDGENEQIVIRATRQQWLAVCDGDMTIVQAALAGDD